MGPYQTLKELPNLAETKLGLVWCFEAGEEITSLCIANHKKNNKTQKQIIVGSKDCTVYSLSIDKLIKDVNFVDGFAVQQELFRQLGKEFENKEEVVNRALEITGSHAYYLQIAFNIILEYLEKNKKAQLTK